MLCEHPQNNLLLLQVVEALLGPLQALQVRHHLLHVVLGVAVLDEGEPAASHADHYGNHQHEVLQVVVSVHWDGVGGGGGKGVLVWYDTVELTFFRTDSNSKTLVASLEMCT